MANDKFTKIHFEDNCDGMLVLNDVFIKTDKEETEAGYSMRVLHLIQDANGAKIFAGTITPSVDEAREAIRWLHLTGEENWAQIIVYDGYLEKAHENGNPSVTNFFSDGNITFRQAYNLLHTFGLKAVMWDERDTLVNRVAINLSDELIAGEIEDLSELEANWLESTDEYVVNYGDELLFDGLTSGEAEKIREQIEELAYSFTKGMIDTDIE